MWDSQSFIWSVIILPFEKYHNNNNLDVIKVNATASCPLKASSAPALTDWPPELGAAPAAQQRLAPSDAETNTST